MIENMRWGACVGRNVDVVLREGKRVSHGVRKAATDPCYSPHLSYRTSSACAQQQRTRFGAALSCELRGVVEEHLRGKNDDEEREGGADATKGVQAHPVLCTLTDEHWRTNNEHRCARFAPMQKRRAQSNNGPSTRHLPSGE